MNDPKPQKSIDDLVREFANGIIQQCIEINAGSVKGSDVAHDRIVHAFGSLTTHFGDKGRESLKELFNHPNGKVRIGAANYLLRYCTDEALDVLKDEVEHGDGYTSFVAKIGIANWEKGEWHLDP